MATRGNRYKSMKTNNRPIRYAGGRRYKGSRYLRRQKWKKVLKIALIAVVCILAVVAGFFLMRFIMGGADDGPVSETLESVTETVPVTENREDETETVPPESETAPVQNETEVHGRLTSADVLNGGSALQQLLDEASSGTINTVVIEMKNFEGYVRYNSKNSDVISNGAVSDPVSDENIKNSINTLRQAGLKVYAKMHCFRDTMAAASMVDASVKYRDEDFNWLDTSSTRGGRPWLNPYSLQARNYLTSIAEELLAYGFDGLMLDSVQRPSGYSLDAANYGPEADTKTVNEVLREFISGVREKAGDSDIIITSTFGGVTEGDSHLYGGKSTELGVETVCPDIRYTQQTEPENGNGEFFENAPEDPEGYMTACASGLGNSLSDSAEIIPIISGTGDVLTRQIDILSQNGITEYIVM